MERQYVAIDLHRRRSVIVRMTREGEKLETVRIDNDPIAFALELAKAGPNPEVVVEATYGWYWLVDLLQAEGARVHLAHPLGLNWENRRVKNDELDAIELADRLRTNRLPEAWIAPPKVRELRELVRYRAKLVALRSGLKAQVHAGMAKQGILPALEDMFGPGGQRWLDEMPLDRVYVIRVESLRDLIEVYDREIGMLEREIASWLRDDKGYWAIQALDGVGRTMAAIFVAEIGDISRFSRPDKLSSWAGLTPKHRESDTKVTRGHITKMGSTLVRWAAVEAVARYRAALPSRMPTRGSLTAGAARSPGWQRPASSSPWSTTACATARSAAWPARPGEAVRARPGRELVERHDPLRAWSAHVIEPAWPWPQRTMPHPGAKECPAAEPRPARPHQWAW